MFLVAGKDFLWSRKTQSRSCFFRERFSIFWDRTVVKTKRSKVLTGRNKDQGKGKQPMRLQDQQSPLLAPCLTMNTQDNALQIAGPKSLDSGSYTCVASNGIDSDSASATLRVQVCFIISGETSPTKQITRPPMSAALQALGHYASRKTFCLCFVVIFGTSIKITSITNL